MSERLAALLESSDTLGVVREALRDPELWLVGGTVRDLLMGRHVDDIDIVVAGDAERPARELARHSNAHVFPLSERFGAWRVLASDRAWQADLTPMRGGSVESDLALRDFTANAMATPLQSAEPLVDPYGGQADIEARLLRVVTTHSYADDPLRTLRMARLACELGFEVEPETARLAAQHVSAIHGVSPERTFYELRRLIAAEGVLRGVELMDAAGLVAELLPELEALKDVEQNPYHHLDVWGHTVAVLEALIDLERGPERVFGDASSAVLAELERPLADDLTRGQALRLAALFHDVGKPATRRVNEDGRVLFWGHDAVGAEMAASACRRLRASRALADFLAAIARHHLRLGFLVHERPLTRRHIYRYLRACEPVELEVTVLSVADRLATRGERTLAEAIEAHVVLAGELAREALDWRARGGPPAAPLRGDELASELGLEPGPRIGELLENVREAVFAGEVSTREEALEHARAALG